jgi:hypothetical protein
MSIRVSGCWLKNTVPGFTGISGGLSFFMKMLMMHFRIPLSMHGETWGTSEMRVLYIPGYIQLPQMKRLH